MVLDVTPLDDGLQVRLLATEGDQGRGSSLTPIPADRTIVTIRKADGQDTPVEGFSFLPADLARGPIRIPDLGVIIAEAGAPVEVAPAGSGAYHLRPRGE